MSKNYALRRSRGVNVYEAFRRLVMGRGTDKLDELAQFMGMKVGTLYNKADAGDDTHNQPTLRDVIQVTHFCQDLSVIDALNELFGRACFDCARYEGTSDEALVELLTQFGAESGEFHVALGQGMKNKRFTRETLNLIRGEAFDVVSALMTLVARLEDYVDEDDAAAR